MALSIREQIMRNVISVLTGVTIANGFDVELLDITRLRTPIVELNDLPGAIVVEGVEAKTPKHIPETAYECVLPVELELWTQEEGERDISDMMTELLANVEKALMVDRLRGVHEVTGNALAMDTVLVGNDAFLSTMEVPLGLVRLNIEITYRHLIGDPFNC